MSIKPDVLAQAGAAAIEAYFDERGATPVSAGDGRFTVYVPGGGGTQDLQLSLASTPAARGILARVKARRTVAAADYGRALVVVNRWNRSSPLPHVVLAARGSGGEANGVLLVEGFLPPSASHDPDQVRRFVETVVAGARRFWSSPGVQQVTHPMTARVPAGDQQ